MKDPCIKMSQCFPKLFEPFGACIKVEVDLFNYETKADLKSATGIDISNLAAKSDLVSLKVMQYEMMLLKKLFKIN